MGTGRDYKTAATDAFKRAAVRFGIGHELYAFEQNWVQVDAQLRRGDLAGEGRPRRGAGAAAARARTDAPHRDGRHSVLSALRITRRTNGRGSTLGQRGIRPACRQVQARHATLGFSDQAALDDGHLWPTSFALTALGPVEEDLIVALPEQATR